nr:hypothetical protein [Pandoravirus massiliensis]
MGRNRKRVGGRAAKRGDAGGKGDSPQAHVHSTMQTPQHDDTIGPETSGFFDVSTLKTVSMSADHLSTPLNTSLDIEPATTNSVADGDGANDNNKDEKDNGHNGACTEPHMSTDLVSTAEAVADKGVRGVGTQHETAPDTCTGTPVDTAPVQRAYDLFARLRVWSAASASAERSVIVDDPSASNELEPVDALRPAERDMDHLAVPGDNGNLAGAGASLESHTGNPHCIEADPPCDDTASDVSLPSVENHQMNDTEAKVGGEPAGALPAGACDRAKLDTADQHAATDLRDHDENGGDNGTGTEQGLDKHTDATKTTTQAAPLGAARNVARVDDTKEGDAVRDAPQQGTGEPQTAPARLTRKRRAARDTVYGTWAHVDEPGWTADVISALDAHVSRAVSGKPSPRIVVFSHGAAPSALALVRRFGPDAIVWVVSSAPDARNIERHGCSVVKWPARTATITSTDKNVPMGDLVNAVPWHCIDAVIDIGTGRPPQQRARTLKTIVPLMHSDAIYACAVDCRHLALELLGVGAAAIVHEHDHAVVVQPARLRNTRP